MLSWLVLFINVFVGAMANIFLKIGSQKIPNLNFKNFYKILGSPILILGVFLFIVNFPLYSYVLQKMKLSVAFPLVTSLTFLLVVIFSNLFLKESLTLIQYLGIVFLILGIIFLSK